VKEEGGPYSHGPPHSLHHTGGAFTEKEALALPIRLLSCFVLWQLVFNVLSFACRSDSGYTVYVSTNISRLMTLSYVCCVAVESVAR
jgi:hypothetical protein